MRIYCILYTVFLGGMYIMDSLVCQEDYFGKFYHNIGSANVIMTMAF